MYMSSLSSQLFGVTGGLTITYYVIKMFIENKPTTIKILTWIYFFLLLGSVFGLVYTETSSMCGEIQWGLGFVYGILPWIMIYGLFSVLLHFCPGWKSPFSNTFGYLYAKIRGASTVLNDMINTKFKSKDIQDIYNDPSLLINTLTPTNFTSAIQKLKSDNIINSSNANFSANLSKLESIVKGKDDVSECIWKLLLSGLISSMSASQIANIKCDHTVKQMQDSHASHTEKLKEESSQKPEKPKQYYVRD